jgi:diaminopimelate decarboxylase
VYKVTGSKPLAPAAEQLAVRYIHVDGGMGDNPRPALYGALYSSILANKAEANRVETVHIAGRYCESGDVLVRNAELPRVEVGDLVALSAAGAYTQLSFELQHGARACSRVRRRRSGAVVKASRDHRRAL